MTVTTLPAGTTTYSVDTTVAAGDTLRFPSGSSATLVMNAKNLIVRGLLEMKPANANVIHTIRFANIDNTDDVGGGLVPLSTDTGLWIVGDGIADLQGTPKVAWNRTGDDPSWGVSDELIRCPYQVGNWTSFASFTKGDAVPLIEGSLGSYLYPAGLPTEILNMTRNVRIEGEPTVSGVTHQAHIFHSSTMPSTFKYIAGRYLGANKLGRYALHHHMCDDGSRGTEVTGCIMRNSLSHAFVPHMSNGVVATFCIAYDVNQAPYWWDAETGSDGTVWADCVAAKYGTNQQTNNAGFNLGSGTNLSNVRSIAVGCNDGQSSAGFMWPVVSTTFDGVWTTEDNVAHNHKAWGSRIWQNNTQHIHEIDRTFIRNCHAGTQDPREGGVLLAGAYQSGYHYNDFDVQATSNAAPLTHKARGNNFLRGQADANNLATYALLSTEHNSSGSGSAANANFTEVQFTNFTQNAVLIDEGPTNHSFASLWYRFIRCTANGVDLKTSDIDILGPASLTPNLFKVQVQHDDNTAEEISYPTMTWAPIAPVAMYISTASLSVATNGVSYSQQLTAALGTVTWALAPNSGPLPTGLSLSSAGVISGTPTQTGTFPITVRASQTSSYAHDKAFTLFVGASSALQITTSSLPGGVVGNVYSQTLVATGGIAPRTFSLASGSLPAGLSLSSAGVISGTPTTAVSSTPTFRVTDAASTSSTRLLPMSVVDLSPIINTTDIDESEVGIDYSFALSASGGTAPITWSVVTGPLPPGLTLSSAGVISGTPTTAGDYLVRLRATDAAAHTATRDFPITTYAALDLPTPSLAIAVVGTPYSDNVTVTGGEPSSTLINTLFTEDPGQVDELPPGLSMITDGTISGTPTTTGTFLFQLLARDSLGGADTTTGSIIVQALTQVAQVDRSVRRSFAQRRPQGGSRIRDKANA